MYLAKETGMKAKNVSMMILISLLLSLLTIGRAQAKEIVKVTIAGPGLNGEVELTDIESLKIIDELGFADQSYQPASIGTEPYFEIRTAVGDGTDIVAIGIYHYYPASKQHPSYIYYPGSINAWSSRDGQYFLVPKDTDQKLHDLLAQLGASLSDTTNPSIITFNLLLPWVWLIVGIVFCISIGIAVRLQRLNSAKTSH
jgi:hypothetical protein